MKAYAYVQMIQSRTSSETLMKRYFSMSNQKYYQSNMIICWRMG